MMNVTYQKEEVTVWNCQLKEVRERRNRWYIEGLFQDQENQAGMPFSISVRFGWVAFEGVAGPLFNQVLEHFKEILGGPGQPPTCSGASECQDDAVHMTTSWEVGEGTVEMRPLLARLLKIPEAGLSNT